MSKMYGIGIGINFENKISQGWDADALKFIDVAGITDLTQKNALNALYMGLKMDGVYSQLWEFLPLIGGTSVKHSIWGKNPSRTQVTWVGSPTHNSNGVKGNGSNQYGNLGWIPYTEGYDEQNFGVCAYRKGLETIGTSRQSIGLSAVRAIGCGLIQAGSRDGGFINNDGTLPTPTAVPTPATQDGFLLIHTYSGFTATVRRNKTVLGTRIQTGGNPDIYSLYILANNNANVANRFTNNGVHSFIGLTKGLTATQADALCDRVTTYQTALGRA